MPVNILTVRVRAADGEVVAVRQEPFLVLNEGESRAQGEVELWRLAEHLLDEAGELEAARHEPGHRHHHWWVS